ncbi:hypothetical protein WICMUC_002113, partial [Wickerhamomyces mucosus]
SPSKGPIDLQANAALQGLNNNIQDDEYNPILEDNGYKQEVKLHNITAINTTPQLISYNTTPNLSNDQPSKFDYQTQLKKKITKDLDISFNSQFNDTTYSQESNYLNHISNERNSYNTSSILGSLSSSSSTNDSYSKSKSQTNRYSFNDKSVDGNDEELYALFLIAIHSFDSNTLELQTDSSICLSFDKNDVIFVHSIDETGWGEVTLIKTLQRGWVPINFFTELIKNDYKLSLNTSRLPLKNLLISSAKFLINPIESDINSPDELNDEVNDELIGNSNHISLGLINDIRDGVKYLLEKTDCLSRSTEIVRQKPIIRKIRKSLLGDWYSLMIKADSYKKSKKFQHLETLQLMVLKLVKKSIGFLELWGIEFEDLQKTSLQNLNSIQKIKKPLSIKPDHSINFPRLSIPPLAKDRLNEIHNILFSYIGLILGRLDMIEHNPTGCQILENLTHQIIILLRELLFISKSCSSILSDRKRKIENKFDDNLDNLLSLVSELVSSVKNFVTKTINEDVYAPSKSLKIKDGIYYYTPEGDELIGVVSRMTRSISISVENCHKSLIIIGDFRLSHEKEYIDFKPIQILPESFIKQCSIGLIENFQNQQIDLKSIKRSNIKRSSRYSMIRSGTNNENSLTTSGSNLLQEFLPESKSFVRYSVFEPYLNESNENFEHSTLNHDIDDEILKDSEGNLLGASLKGLIFLLTNELNKPDQFLISAFFLTFKLYSSSSEIIEELISRFNVNNKFDSNDNYDEIGEYSSYDSRLKNRRKLICKTFQIWLQSYWDYEHDYNLLPTLINFFNEGVSQFLPIEYKKLIELSSKLTCLTPSKINENKDNLIEGSQISQQIAGTDYLQLVNRKVGSSRRSTIISHSASINSLASLNSELDNDDYIFEEYELAKMSSNNRNSILLPLPVLNFNNNSLLSKSQIQEIENFVLSYRRTLGTSVWSHAHHNEFYPIELKKLLKTWFANSQLELPNFSIDFNGLDYNLSEINSFEIAKQLTLIESKIFIGIKSNELLNISKFQQKSFSNATNISYSLLFTNLLTEYVFDSILQVGLSTKKRVLRLKNWLNIALSCYYLKNYNSLAAIIISLQNHLLSRLDIIWNALSDKYTSLFDDLKKIIHPNNNFKGYRLKMNKILETELIETKASVSTVPYINLFLQDLTFINEGNRDFRNSNSFLRSRIINFDKFLKISKIVSNVEFLQVGYDTNKKSSSNDFNQNRRSSIFSFSSSNSLNESLSPILSLQEFILLEFLRVHQSNVKNEDRYWELSKRIKN